METLTLLDGQKFQITIQRLCHQLIENHNNFSDTVLIGIQPRGIYLADRIHQELKHLQPQSELQAGNLDITFFRDDFRTNKDLPAASATAIDFII